MRKWWKRRKPVAVVTAVPGWAWRPDPPETGQEAESLYYGEARVACTAAHPDGGWYWFVPAGNPAGILPADSRVVFRPYPFRDLARHDALHYCRTALATGTRLERIRIAPGPPERPVGA